jgi:hypothetical protein
MSEFREKLKPFQNKRVTVHGTLVEYGLWTQNYREVGRFCIEEVEMNGEVVCDHVWVMGTNHLERCELGRRVELDAMVNQYADHAIGGNNYGLKNPSKLVLLDKPVALTIPHSVASTTSDPPEEIPMLTNGQTDRLDVKNVTDHTAGGLDMAKTAMAFIKAAGGLKRAKKCLEAIPADVPLAVLSEWVGVLAGE